MNGYVRLDIGGTCTGWGYSEDLNEDILGPEVRAQKNRRGIPV